uniref:Uncharacterized protein n=1 Tax=Meloidogyne enterolobii TaxID=390850 RepID=A0A6V7W8B5_MELEN|nr:unnamed protein product [Meloidogyne enterolobii]
MQSLWAITPALTWDEEIPANAKIEWAKIIKNWTSTTISFPRKCFSLNSKNINFQLHAFTDASQIAFAVTIYLRSFDQTKNIIESNLIFCKTKVKPKTKSKKSPYTIPRLELLGVLIGVRALNFLKKQLSFSINLDKTLFLWTDSSTVLNWLNNDEQINDVFVNNRIKEIRQIDHLEVGHVTGYSNPADLASRGENDVDSFQNNQMYWHGPLWLLSNEWPTHKFKIALKKKYSHFAIQ